jgi:hypothetical protein
MKQAKGTNRPLGTKGGCSAGMESGCAEVMKIKASEGPEITSGSQRPKAANHGSIAKK